MSQEHQYAVKIISAINSCFDEDSENHISRQELMEGDNLTHFFQALANLAPAMIYRRLTGEEVNNLEFNHIANQLVFQYSNLVKNEEE